MIQEIRDRWAVAVKLAGELGLSPKEAYAMLLAEERAKPCG